MVLNLNDVRLTKLIVSVLNRVCQSLWCYKTGMWALTAAARRWTRERRRRTRQRLTDDEGVEGGLMWPHYLAIGQSLPSRNKFVSLTWAVTDRGGHSGRNFSLQILIPIELYKYIPRIQNKTTLQRYLLLHCPWLYCECVKRKYMLMTQSVDDHDLEVGNSDGNDGDQWWRSKQSLCSILIHSS